MTEETESSNQTTDAQTAETQTTESQAAETGAETKATNDKPEYVPEKFWDTEKGEVNVENLAKSYVEIDKLRGSMKEKALEEAKKELEELKAQSVPEKYEIKLPEVPEGVNINIEEDDPLLKSVTEIARKYGLPQEGFDELLSAKIEADLASTPSYEQEMAKLGTNAEARINRVSNWIDANLDKQSAEAIKGVAVTSDIVIALEKIVAANTGAAFLIDNSTGVEEGITIDKLREMQADPRYFDPRKREDSFVKKVEEGYKMLYSSRKRAR